MLVGNGGGGARPPLSNPDPYDLTQVDLGEYRGIVAPWNDWHAVVTQCRSLAFALLGGAPGNVRS